jgi:hypothetical protein
MMKTLFGAGILALSLSFVAGAAFAGPIQSACLQSSRNAATAGLCSCIQQVADVTLGGADQRRAAGFFRNPDKAQDVRMSKTRNDDAFWDRYQIFGQRAEMVCAG